GRAAPRTADRAPRLAGAHRRTRPERAELRRGVRRPVREERTMSEQPTTPVARFGAFIGSLIAAAWLAAMNGIGNSIAWFERWLFDGKKALYGIAVTRIVFGLTALGLLISNFGTRLYTFGSGSAWNGEIAAPLSD